MGLPARLRSVIVRLQSAPLDPAAWQALAAAVRRLGRPTSELVPELAGLPRTAAITALALAPEERGLADWILELRGLRADWVDGEIEAGLPRQVTRVRDEARMLRLGATSTYLDQHPLSVRAYRRYLEVAAPPGRPHPEWRELKRYQDWPVVFLTHGQAERYALWVGATLPDEAMWLQAAYAEDGRRFPWGEETPTAKHVACREHGPADRGEETWHELLPRLGERPEGAGPFGHQDLLGGVWEWLATPDWFDDDELVPTDSQRVSVGGSYQDSLADLVPPGRAEFEADEGYAQVGMRLAVRLT